MRENSRVLWIVLIQLVCGNQISTGTISILPVRIRCLHSIKIFIEVAFFNQYYFFIVAVPIPTAYVAPAQYPPGMRPGFPTYSHPVVYPQPAPYSVSHFLHHIQICLYNYVFEKRYFMFYKQLKRGLMKVRASSPRIFYFPHPSLAVVHLGFLFEMYPLSCLITSLLHNCWAYCWILSCASHLL